MAEFQVPNPTMSLATEDALGRSVSIAPANFYNPIVPAKDYSSGLVEPNANDKTQDILENIANSIFDTRVKEINKNNGLTNPLTNPRQVEYEQTKRYQDAELGYVDSPNIEYMYGENQGLGGAIGNALIQSGGNFISSFLGAFTNEYAIGAALGTQDLSSLFDNNLVNAANTFSEIGQEWGTIYDTRQMADNPLFSRKLLTSTISSIGYLGAFAGAAVKDVGISAILGPEAGVGLAGIQLAQAFNKIKDFGKVFSNGEDGIRALQKSLQVTKNLETATAQAAKTVPFREGFRKFNQYTQGMFEAAIEAKETVKGVEEKLKDEFFLQNGYNPSGEELEGIKGKANEAGNYVYFANAALLTGTNHFEFGELFERWRVGKRGFDTRQGNLDLGLDGYNKVINNAPAREVLPKSAKFLDKAKDFAVRAATNTPSALTLSTGEFIEEMGQGVISGSAEDYYTNFINPASSGVESILRATAKQFGTQEGWLSGLSGILTGASMSGILSAAGVNPMDKTPSNVYTDAVISDLNNNNLGSALKEKIRMDQKRKTGDLTKEERYTTDYENQSEDHLNSYQYWITGLKHGQYELRLQQLQEAKNLTGKDFTDEWGMEFNEENQALVNGFIDEHIAKGAHMKEVFNIVDRTFINPFDRRTRKGRSADNSTSYALYDAVKDELIFQISKFDNNAGYINKLTNQARENLKILSNDEDLLDLASLYGEEIDEKFAEKDGAVIKRYNIKSKKQNTNQGLARVKKDLDKEIADLDKTLESEIIVGEDRREYVVQRTLKNALAEQISKFEQDGLTETVEKDGKLVVQHTEDYLKFLSEYLVYRRMESGVKEPLTSTDFANFYKGIMSINQASLSNERTSKIMNDLMSADAVKNFKKQAEEITKMQDKIIRDNALKQEEEEKTKTSAKTPEDVKVDAADTPQETPEIETPEEIVKAPETGEVYKGTVYTKDEEGDDIVLEGDVEVLEVNNIDETITVKSGGVERTIPLEDFKDGEIEKVNDSSNTPEKKIESSKPAEVYKHLDDDQAQDISETIDILSEETITSEEIAEVNLDNNTFTVVDSNEVEQVFNTLTKALDQKYPDNLDTVYKKVAMQTSTILHALFNKPETTYGEIENIPDINEIQFNQIYEGYKVYNQWLIDNNKEVVDNDFYIQDYNVNSIEGNNALIHIDLLIYDKNNNLYQVVDFKTRSKYSAQKITGGVKGNSPDEWDRQQLDYKVDALKKTLSNRNIKSKNFKPLNYLFRFDTEYTQVEEEKVLDKITHRSEPITIFGKGHTQDVIDAEQLKIEGHTISSLMNLPTKEFTEVLKKNRIPYRFLTPIIEQYDKFVDRSLEDLPKYDSTPGAKNPEFWDWLKDNYTIFKLKQEANEISQDTIERKVDEYIQALNKEVLESEAPVSRSYNTEAGAIIRVKASENFVTKEIEYTTPEFRFKNVDVETLRSAIIKKEIEKAAGTKNYYVPKQELYVRTNFTKKYAIFVNGRSFEDGREVQKIIDDYGTTNLKSIVQGIADKSNVSSEKELAANIVSKIPKRFTVEFIDSNTKDNRVASHYDPISEKLVINVAMLKELGYATDNAILHETIHVLTAQRLKTNTTFMQDIDSLLKQTKAFLNTTEGRTVLGNIYGTTNAEIYGISSVDEFLAEAMTSPDFQNLLRTIKSKIDKDEKLSLWNKFLDFIRKSLGIDLKDFQDSILAKVVYRVGKEFDTLSVENIGNGLNLDHMFGKTILKIESFDQYAPTNAFGNRVIRENSLEEIYDKAVITREVGAEPNFKPLTGFDNIFVSKYPFNLVIKYPNEQGGMDPFTSIGLTAGYRFKRTQGGSTNTSNVSVTKSDYNKFVDDNVVSDSILNSIAEKVIRSEKLDNYETAIFNGKTSEINNLIVKSSNAKITASDKIVFGHPTIGKSFLKNNNDNRFISLDDDYSSVIKTFVSRIAKKYNVTESQVKDGSNESWNKEYNDEMQLLFNKAREQALKENKTLFTSNTNLLRNNASAFDKVINIPREEFEKRINQRGAKYDITAWKDQIEQAIAKVPNTKVITTSGYLSDLLDSNTVSNKPSGELLTLDQLSNPDISDEEFEQITHVDRSLRSEFINKLNNYISFQTSLSDITTDVPLKETNVELSINTGTLQLVPYSKRTNVNELKPMMFRGVDGVSPAPLILERQYVWQLNGGKTRDKEGGFTSIYNDPVFDGELAGVLNFVRENIGTINNNLKSTYVLVIPKGGVQSPKREGFSLNDFDYVPIYPDQYDITDNTYLNNLKFLSSYVTKGLPADMYEQSLEAERGVKNVYVASPENFQFQNIDSTMAANAAEITITDGNGNSKAKGYLQYKFRSSTTTDDLTVSISPERLAEVNSMNELIDILNDELELKIRGSLVNIKSGFKISPDNFKITLPKPDEIGVDQFVNSITEGSLTTPLHRNIRNVSLNIIPKQIVRDTAQPKENEVIYSEPTIPEQREAQEIVNKVEDVPVIEITPEMLAKARAKGKVNLHSRRKPSYGFPGINDDLISDLINVCG